MIDICDVSKVFLLPHEKKTTLRQRFVSLWQRNTYEKFYALRNVDMHIKQGEFIGIIGKNGSGKSTLLKLIAKVLEPSSGKVSVNANVAPFLELGVGFQWESTVRDNIFLYSALLGMGRKETVQKYDRILEFSGLEKFVDAKLKNLSSGMQVRLGFSITVSVDSPILLVDEVLAVGDIDFQKKCYDVFNQFKAQGKTIVFVSHDLAAVEKFCDKAVWLKNGKINAAGNPAELVNQYMSLS